MFLRAPARPVRRQVKTRSGPGTRSRGARLRGARRLWTLRALFKNPGTDTRTGTPRHPKSEEFTGIPGDGARRAFQPRCDATRKIPAQSPRLLVRRTMRPRTRPGSTRRPRPGRTPSLRSSRRLGAAGRRKLPANGGRRGAACGGRGPHHRGGPHGNAWTSNSPAGNPLGILGFHGPRNRLRLSPLTLSRSTTNSRKNYRSRRRVRPEPRPGTRPRGGWLRPPGARRAEAWLRGLGALRAASPPGQRPRAWPGAGGGPRHRPWNRAACSLCRLRPDGGLALCGVPPGRRAVWPMKAPCT